MWLRLQQSQGGHGKGVAQNFGRLLQSNADLCSSLSSAQPCHVPAAEAGAQKNDGLNFGVVI